MSIQPVKPSKESEIPFTLYLEEDEEKTGSSPEKTIEIIKRKSEEIIGDVVAKTHGMPPHIETPNPSKEEEIDETPSLMARLEKKVILDPKIIQEKYLKAFKMAQEKMNESLSYTNMPTFFPFIKDLTVEKISSPFIDETTKKEISISSHTSDIVVGTRLIKSASSSTQGKRDYMEDTNGGGLIKISTKSEQLDIGCFAIFDGHGGSLVANQAKEKLMVKLEETFHEFKEFPLETLLWNGLKRGFVKFNEYTHEEGIKSQKELDVGSTATAVFFVGNELYCANLGDSGACYYKKGTYQTVALSTFQKPNFPYFEKGVEKRGGFVYYGKVPRVSGILTCARAFGHWPWVKERIIEEKVQKISSLSARPKIVSIQEEGGYVIIASDGLWDVMNFESAGVALNLLVEKNFSLEQIAQSFVWTALKMGSLDNITVTIVKTESQSKSIAQE